MRNIRLENPTISDINLVEGVFGDQNHGIIRGMGLAQSKKVLQQHNLNLQKKLEQISKAQEESETRRLADKVEYDARRLTDLEAFESRIVADEARRLKDLAESEARRIEDNTRLEKKLFAMMSIFSEEQSQYQFNPSSSMSHTSLDNIGNQNEDNENSDEETDEDGLDDNKSS